MSWCDVSSALDTTRLQARGASHFDRDQLGLDALALRALIA
jgi:hypothetical protein